MNTTTRRLLKIVLSFLMAIALAPSFVFGEESTATELTASGGTLSAGSYILNGDVKLTTDLTIASDTEVTIDLNSHTLTGTGSGSVITVNGTLTIKDTSDSGDGKITGGTGTAAAASNAKTYSGNNAASYFGGGVFVNGGTLNITGGSITGNTITTTSSYVRGYGAGVYVYNGTLNMTGGSISNNTISYSSGTTYGYGAGIGAYKSTISLKNAAVESNSINGKYVYGGGIWIYGSHSSSSGITYANLTIINSSISKNTITTTGYSGSGGGIYGCYANVTYSSGSIDSNSSYTSGGIYLGYYSKFSMSGGTVSNNKATSTAGGVYLDSNGTSDTYKDNIKITGGEITGNSVSGSVVSWCGGLYVGNSYVTLSNCTIANNTATYYAADLLISATGMLNVIATNVNSDVVYTGDNYGLKIDGWYKDNVKSRYSSTNITEKVTDFTTTNSTSSNLYLIAAHGTAYTVTYTDGIDDESDSNIFDTQTSYTTGSVPDFTGSTARTGYTFKGWTTDSEVTDSSVIITDFSSTTITDNTTYYAVWTKNTYALNIDDIDSLSISTDDEGNETMTYSDTVYDSDSGRTLSIPAYVNGEEATSDVIKSVSTESSNITVGVDDDGTGITLTLSGNLSSGEYSETFTVTYEDDSTETVTLTFTVECDHDYDYDDIEWTWSDDYTSATATLTCSKDSSHTKTIEAAITSETTSPTFTSEGKTVYTATITVDGVDYTDTKTVSIDRLKLSVVESQSANVTITTDDSGTMILSITSAVTSDDTQKIILSLSGDIELSDESVTIETEYGYVTVEIDEDGNLVITPDIDALADSGTYTDTITITVISEDGTSQDIIVTFTYDADTGEITEETADTGDGDNSNDANTSDDVETEVTKDGEDGSATTATYTSSDVDETAEADTSDHTAMYVYALLGLTAAAGACYVVRRRKES